MFPIKCFKKTVKIVNNIQIQLIGNIPRSKGFLDLKKFVLQDEISCCGR